MTGVDRLLSDLADLVVGLRPGRRVRVGVDGPDCAGKTTVADALGARVAARRPVVRTGVDEYPNPPEVRYRRGRESAEGCYRDTTDLALLRQRALDPFGPDGDGRVRLRVWDEAAAGPIDLAPQSAPPDAVLLVDGVFLRRPELAGTWDLCVLLEVGDDEAVRRAVVRDGPWLGTPDRVEHLYRVRYLAAQRLYRAEAAPAEVVMDNSDPAAPVVLRWPC